MTAKLTNYDADICMNFDETPMRPWKTSGRVILEKSDVGHVKWKENDFASASIKSYNS